MRCGQALGSALMTRLRDLDVIPGRLPCGPLNAITDVPGVRVGHTTRFEGEAVRTGVTAVVPHDGDLFQEKVVAGVQTINGFGKATGFEQIREIGTLETPILLTNTLNVPRAADALLSYTLRRNADAGLTAGTINPVVGECNDAYLNDLRGRHVSEDDVLHAVATASDGAVREGCVGAGTGTSCYQFKGGIGSASRMVLGQFTVGALVQTNMGRRQELTILGVPVGMFLHDHLLPDPDPGSIMMVIATDAPLDSSQLRRLAMRAAFGLARTGSICAHGSGDFAIAFSTAARIPHTTKAISTRLPHVYQTPEIMDAFFLAVIECIEESIYNALTAAETTTGRDGHTLHKLPLDALADLLRLHKRS
jgi:D-aminopeptidase